MGEQKYFKSGEVIIEQGGNTDKAILILEGNLEACRLIDGEDVILAIFTPGQWAGDAKLPFEKGVPAKLKASTDAVVLESETKYIAATEGHIKSIVTRSLSSYLKKITQGLINHQAHLVAREKYLSRLAVEKTSEDNDYEAVEKVFSIVGKMPTLPAHATRLLAIIHDEDTSAKEILAITKEDSSLVADILKEVNSASYGLEHRFQI